MVGIRINKVDVFYLLFVSASDMVWMLMYSILNYFKNILYLQYILLLIDFLSQIRTETRICVCKTRQCLYNTMPLNICLPLKVLSMSLRDLSRQIQAKKCLPACYLKNHWLERYQICISISLRQDQWLIRCW